MQESSIGYIIILVGIIITLGAILNWGIVVGPGKIIPRLLGPKLARIFMILLGILLVFLGMGMILNLL